MNQRQAGSTTRRAQPSGPSVDNSTAARLPRVAAALFREKGFASATTRQLAEALGIQKASLYHHIRSKDDLLYAISMESLDHIYAAVEQAGARAEASSRDRLRAMIMAHVTTALADRDMHATMLVELRALSDERLREVLDARDRYESLLRRTVLEEQDAGRVRSDIDARYLTLSMLNLLNWTIFWFDPEGARSAEDISEMLATIFLEGAQIATD
jgi:AcrR family transcriptional regulator